MKKILLLSITTLLLCVGCSDDDSAPAVNPLNASWNLTNVSGSLLGIDQDIEEGLIVWAFNTTNNTVTVVNNNTDEDVTDFFESGTYNYSYETNYIGIETCAESLKVNDINFGCQNITGNTMILSDIAADGYQLTFTK
ncbi:MAG: hypothetical protein BM557_06770 [Flavobacterium sp. MedPE-SWcel]|uniref:hypothetical protein n=1 Tax=uncultured Flavobacterium sp. TaxID=165435 RepID=UPI00091EC3EF|nr:hypothetical protein [uncultured Flavobacterium sp.]OIQ18622.1 MAG: hypothetical protein BM557_06770 [Flavobacterium sp. MedPE-SWcel]